MLKRKWRQKFAVVFLLSFRKGSTDGRIGCIVEINVVAHQTYEMLIGFSSSVFLLMFRCDVLPLSRLFVASPRQVLVPIHPILLPVYFKASNGRIAHVLLLQFILQSVDALTFCQFSWGVLLSNA